jgi:hypothetical protein
MGSSSNALQFFRECRASSFTRGGEGSSVADFQLASGDEFAQLEAV